MNTTRHLTTCRTPGCTAGEHVDHYTLHRTSTSALIDGIIRLTNMVRNARTADDMADRRAHRDIIKAELIRRTEHQS